MTTPAKPYHIQGIWKNKKEKKAAKNKPIVLMTIGEEIENCIKNYELLNKESK